MATGKILNGEPHAGSPHVRFDGGKFASAAMSKRGLHCKIAKNVILVCACALALTVPATVTRTVCGSSYVVNVDGGDADEALTPSDYTVLLGNGTPLDLVKTGTGRLYIPFDMTNTVDATLNWQGATIVSNGFLRADKVGSLGDRTGSLTVIPGASFEINWKAEKVGTPMQQRHVYVGGDGVDGQRGAIRSWSGDSYALGLVDFTADTYVNDKKNGSEIPVEGNKGDSTIGIRYNDVHLNGHTVTTGGSVFFAAVSRFYGPGRLVADSWTKIRFEGAVTAHDSDISVELKRGAVLELKTYSKDNVSYYTMPVKMADSSSISAVLTTNPQNADRVFLNGWGGPIELTSGTIALGIDKTVCDLESTASAAKTPFRFNAAVIGNGTLEVKRGIAWFRSEANAFSGLTLTTLDGYSGRVRLRTADSVLRVRTFTIDGVAQAEGSYTPTSNPGRILQGTIVVDPAAPVAVASAAAGEQFAHVDRTSGNMTGTFTVDDGLLDVAVSGGGSGVLRLDDNAIAGLLGAAAVRLDASDENAFVFESTTDASGNPHVNKWKNLIADANHATKWTGENCPKPETYGTNFFRAVRSPATLQNYTYNNVTMKYVDFGEIEQTPMNYNTTSETASAMKFTTPALQEVHVVHADAHLTGTYRNAILGMTWNNPNNSNKSVGRRGGDQTFFNTANDSTVAYRDGRLYVDNTLRDNTFVPAEDDVHVYTMIPTPALADPPATFNGHSPGTLCCDGWCGYGGARIGEVLVYTAKNSEADRAQIDSYLLMKWTGQGTGPKIQFGKVTLADGVNLSIVGHTRDFVKGVVSVRGLAGNGTVDAGADTLSCSDISTSFASPSSCGCIHVAGAFSVPASGTITIALPVRPSPGEYVILSANSLSGGENVRDWNVELQGEHAAGARASVFMRGNDLVLSVASAGTVLILR